MDAALAPAALQAIVQIGIGLLFAGGGIAKLVHRRAFADAIAAYRLLPLALIAPVAIVLPLAELAVGAALVCRLGAIAIVAGGALLLLFTAGIAINLLRGRTEIDCGCNPGKPGRPISWLLVARNLGLVAALLLCLPPAAPLPAELWFTIVVGGVLLAVIARIFFILRTLAPLAPSSPNLKA